jgi:hypothetical protein
LRKHQFVRDGYIRDSAIFSIVAEEWPLLRLELQKKLRLTSGHSRD